MQGLLSRVGTVLAQERPSPLRRPPVAAGFTVAAGLPRGEELGQRPPRTVELALPQSNTLRKERRRCNVRMAVPVVDQLQALRQAIAYVERLDCTVEEIRQKLVDGGLRHESRVLNQQIPELAVDGEESIEELLQERKRRQLEVELVERGEGLRNTGLEEVNVVELVLLDLVHGDYLVAPQAED